MSTIVQGRSSPENFDDIDDEKSSPSERLLTALLSQAIPSPNTTEIRASAFLMPRLSPSQQRHPLILNKPPPLTLLQSMRNSPQPTSDPYGSIDDIHGSQAIDFENDDEIPDLPNFIEPSSPLPVPGIDRYETFNPTGILESNLFTLISLLKLKRIQLRTEQIFHFYNYKQMHKKSNKDTSFIDTIWNEYIKCFLLDGQSIAMALTEINLALCKSNRITLQDICRSHALVVQFAEFLDLIDTRLKIWFTKKITSINDWSNFIQFWAVRKNNLCRLLNNVSLLPSHISSLAITSSHINWRIDLNYNYNRRQINILDMNDLFNVWMAGACFKFVDTTDDTTHVAYYKTQLDSTLQIIQIDLFAGMTTQQQSNLLKNMLLNNVVSIHTLGLMSWLFATNYALKRHTQHLITLPAYVIEQIYLSKQAYFTNLLQVIS